MGAKWKTINRRIVKQTGLAMIYADDGALYTAAKILTELAVEVSKAAKSKDRDVNRYLDQMEGRTNGR